MKDRYMNSLSESEKEEWNEMLKIVESGVQPDLIKTSVLHITEMNKAIEELNKKWKE
mgnify:FL=1